MSPPSPRRPFDRTDNERERDSPRETDRAQFRVEERRRDQGRGSATGQVGDASYSPSLSRGVTSHHDREGGANYAEVGQRSADGGDLTDQRGRVNTESGLTPGRLQSRRISQLFHDQVSRRHSPSPRLGAPSIPTPESRQPDTQADPSAPTPPKPIESKMNPAYMHQFPPFLPPSHVAGSFTHLASMRPRTADADRAESSTGSFSATGSYSVGPRNASLGMQGGVRDAFSAGTGWQGYANGLSSQGMNNRAGPYGREGQAGQGESMSGSDPQARSMGSDTTSYQTFPPVNTHGTGGTPTETTSGGTNGAEASSTKPTLPQYSMGPYAFGVNRQDGQSSNLGAQQTSEAYANPFPSNRYSAFRQQQQPQQHLDYGQNNANRASWSSPLTGVDPISSGRRGSSFSSADGRMRTQTMLTSPEALNANVSVRDFGMAPRPFGITDSGKARSVASAGQARETPLPQEARQNFAAQESGPARHGVLASQADQGDSEMSIAKVEESSPEPVTKPGKEAEEKVDHRKRKRNRTIQSCLPCHQNKRKCDRKRPCSRCTALSLTGTCVYEVDVARDPNDPEQADNDHLRGRIAELEQVVRELRAKATRTATNTAPPKQDDTPSSSSSKRRKLEDPASPPPSHVLRGTVSRSSAEDYAVPLSAPYNARYETLPGEEMVGDVHGRRAYVGEPGGRDLLKKLAALGGGPASVPEDAAFRGVFPDTTSTFPFTTIWSHENFSSEIIGLLPSVAQSKVLWAAFEEEIAMFFSAWHLPTLRSEFHSFFTIPDEAKMATPLGALSTYLMICALGILVRASEKEIIGGKNPRDASIEDLTTSRLQGDLYLSGSYHALRLCSFLSSPTIATIQTQIMISIFLLNSERASDVWPVLGSLIRQALAIGLNIDPIRHDAQMSLKEAEIRRRVWWTLAGLDSLVCLSLGRPHAITYWSTQLPQDRPDEALIDGQGKASDLFPPSNVLTNEATSASYHTAYFALTIPSIEILERIFQRERRYCRSGTRGWFQAPLAESNEAELPGSGMSTYQDAVDLDADIAEWYRTIPRGISFDPDHDTAEDFLTNRTRARINQTLALNVKTNMVRLILHRPYLRADPAAYPHSSAICLDAAHTILSAYKMMHATGSSIAWSWWTMSLRAFHSSAVCAFLAARQPGLAIADQCLRDIRGALNIFQGRVSTWPKAHPVQGHLIHGLLALEELAATAISRHHAERGSGGSSANKTSPSSAFKRTPQIQINNGSYRDLSTIPAFPDSRGGVMLPAAPSTGKSSSGDNLAPFPGLVGSPGFGGPHGTQAQSMNPSSTGGDPSERSSAGSSSAMAHLRDLPFTTATGKPQNGFKSPTGLNLNMPQTVMGVPDMFSLGFGGPTDTLALPQFWAEVFNIPIAPNTPPGNFIWNNMPPIETPHMTMGAT